MQVAGTRQSEVRETIEVAFEMANKVDDDTLDIRQTLADVGFTRALRAPKASIDRIGDRMAQLAPLMRDLPDLTPDEASLRLNEELTELPIVPSIVDHDGSGPHIHWTSNTATFDDQVFADILIALAQEICDYGTSRFGRCGAHDCRYLFYDTTRNHSRRFCSDKRCASKTHTAAHRARQRSVG